MVLCNHSSLITDPKESVKKPKQIKDQSTFGTESVTLNVEEKKKKNPTTLSSLCYHENVWAKKKKNGK